DEGPRYVRQLIDWGAVFDRAADGTLELGLEAAHGRRRVRHAGRATGRGIGRALWEHVARIASVRVQEQARAVSLMVEDGRCGGGVFAQGDRVGSVALRG